VTEQRPCVICAHQSTPRMACSGCTERIREQLTDLPEFLALSAAEYWPVGGGKGGRSTEVSIGLRVEALDARTTREPLEVLESWERLFREEWSDDHADTQQRARKAARWADSDSDDFHAVNLCGVVDWLCRQLERIADHPAVDEFALEVKALHKTAARGAREPREDVTVIACPADHGDGLCGKPLRLEHEHVQCGRCGADWDRPRLLIVARYADVEVWQPAGVVSEYLGIPERTLRHWAQHGHIKRRGGSLLWSSVVAHIGRTEDVG
jgi:hypothetical protein